MKLFKDNNDINEKAVAGFISLFVMIAFAVVDIISGAMGKELLVNEFIFNAFLILSLGCLGIASVDKFINVRKEMHNNTLNYNNNEDNNNYDNYNPMLNDVVMEEEEKREDRLI